MRTVNSKLLMWQWPAESISSKFGDSSVVEVALDFWSLEVWLWFGLLTVLERGPFACGVFHHPFPVLPFLLRLLE